MTDRILASSHCWSDYRLERLSAQLQSLGANQRVRRVRSFFMIQGDAPLAALRQLLGPGPDELAGEGQCVYVVPRIGTVSPWSSKATDIARVCGLSALQRLERGRMIELEGASELRDAHLCALHDPMMETVLTAAAQLTQVFSSQLPRPLRKVPVLTEGRDALSRANRQWGLALSEAEIDYLVAHAQSVRKDPTDAELMMFAQVNSEHCRHKIFNAAFTVDGESQDQSLFQMIQDSYAASPDGVLSAYKDNAAVIEGSTAMRWMVGADGVWHSSEEAVDILMKVETHNHPTGISPHPGAATGAGGEIRDEAATGRGGKPKAGLCGFSVANLRIPALSQPWESDAPRPPGMASALDIMLEAPIGAASYNNEFGRPNLSGYFRSFEMRTADDRERGYFKPIMIAGGYGNMRRPHVEKRAVVSGAQLIVLGGPAMLIGLGGGAASSMATGSSSADLDFASVQRANPELQRRCQEVVDACWAMGDQNPIVSIHDVGAGGLSNALPELVDADGRGGHFRLRDIQSADPALSPMEIWCNESQERYVLAVAESDLPLMQRLCARERCPMAVVGQATAEAQLIVEDHDASRPVDMPMSVLLGKPPRMQRQTQREANVGRSAAGGVETSAQLKALALDVLRHPSVGSKQFLITIGDRTVGGLSVRDQMVGPWQLPVADCAVTASGFESTAGEAMSMGERPVIALLNAPASGRMAVGEALTNLAAADVPDLESVRLSANWMAACGQGDEDARLFDTVRAVGSELCPALGIAIPVGKDSLSMKSVWETDGKTHTQTAPLSLIVSAFAPVADVRRSLTPQLRAEHGRSKIVLLDLGQGQNRMGGSIAAQVRDQLGDVPPDLDDPNQFKAAFALLQQTNRKGQLLAYHDRSDGGLFAALCEMAFAGRCGLDVNLPHQSLADAHAALFSEELGMLLQLSDADAASFLEAAQAKGLHAQVVAQVASDQQLRFSAAGESLFSLSRVEAQQCWSQVSYQMAKLRDHPECADQEFESIAAEDDPGLRVELSFDPAPLAAPAIGKSPRVAILREQGVNGQAEMAYAFAAAGFEAVDVHMTDILSGRTDLSSFAGLVACGGFSYGDVLGAGQGWARSILFNERAREAFAAFFADSERFALGVCNGCQMLATLRELIPGTAHWPRFVRNHSEQFEARWSMVEIADSKSIFFQNMAGSRLPVAVAHGEGRIAFDQANDLSALGDQQQLALRFIDARNQPAQAYPANPNGSPDGLTGVCNTDGRVTILMPHPERTVHGVTGSWWPRHWGSKTPWFRMFENARRWVGR
ncbi:MAG: phosphoribosylformylglycinamidine synthase [Panacagrimonas sp.]